MEKIFTVKALKRFISESSNEFKPVLGINVEKDNKSINGKAYSDAKKMSKDYDGGLENAGGKRAKYKKEDGNRTTLDYEPENVTDSYKKRLKAQAEGYTSELEKNNKIEKSGDFSDNDNIYNEFKKSGQEFHEGEKDMKKSGLQGREWPEKVFDREEMYESKDGFNMRQMINKMRILQENFDGSLDDFYKEEDDRGEYGEPGMVKSYDIGWNNSVESFEKEASEEGMSLEDYLKYWWNEISSEYVPFTWQKLGSGYGFHGREITRVGNVIFKDIYGQLMVDESAPDKIEIISPSPKAFYSVLNKLEGKIDNGIKIERDEINWLDGYRSQMPEDLIDRWDDLRAQIMNSNLLRENKSIKTIFFKKTEFLTEGHMLSRIPDEFKNEGEQFRMKDKTGNIYLIEWRNNKGIIKEHKNPQGLEESLTRIKDLYDYSSKDTQTSMRSRLNEEGYFNSTLDKVRKIND